MLGFGQFVGFSGFNIEKIDTEIGIACDTTKMNLDHRSWLYVLEIILVKYVGILFDKLEKNTFFVN